MISKKIAHIWRLTMSAGARCVGAVVLTAAVLSTGASVLQAPEGIGFVAQDLGWDSAGRAAVASDLGWDIAPRPATVSDDLGWD